MNRKFIFVFLVESHSSDFQPKNEKIKSKTDQKPGKRTMMDQLRPETRKPDRNQPIWARN